MKDVNILIENGANVKKALELFGDMETYDQTLDVFLNDVPDKLQKIKNCKEIGDMANYAILVHSLKSDARYFGFENLGEIAYQHEIESKANNLFYVTEHFDELMTEANRVLNLVKKYLGVGNVSESAYKKEESHDRAILIVDDSHTTRILQKNILSNYGYNISTATNPINALEKTNQNKYDLIISDVQMPEMNGFEFIRELRKNPEYEDTPVIVVSSEPKEKYINEAKETKISTYIEKNLFKQEELIAEIEKIFKSN